MHSFKEKGKDINKLTSLYVHRLSVMTSEDSEMINEPIIHK